MRSGADDGGKDGEHEEGMGTSGEIRHEEPHEGYSVTIGSRQEAPQVARGQEMPQVAHEDPWVEAPDDFSLRVRAWTWLRRRRRRRE